ncbi:MAG: hypothetical protein Q4D35_03010, partial [Ruminococcus sp.]|nr:hypothetical protein [Ruminococcus sp.]
MKITRNFGFIKPESTDAFQEAITEGTAENWDRMDEILHDLDAETAIEAVRGIQESVEQLAESINTDKTIISANVESASQVLAEANDI